MGATGRCGLSWSGGITTPPPHRSATALKPGTREATSTACRPPEQVNQHEETLKQHGKQYEFHRYDGAGHGFFYYHMPTYRQQAAMDGWDKVDDFFKQYLT